MEKRIIGSDIGAYAFDKTAKTVTITGVASFLASRVLSITNVTRSALIYVAEGDTTLGGTWAGAVVTLDYDTSTHDNGDELRILYSIPESLDGGYAKLSEISAKLPTPVSTVPDNTSAGVPVRQVGEDIWRCSFAESGASVLSSHFELLHADAGVGYSQSSGNLNITAGVVANEEFLVRSRNPVTGLPQAWRGAWNLRFSHILSQRNANNNFEVLLADRIADDLAFVINSATSVTFTFPTGTNPFTSQNVGQFIMIGGITSAAVTVPGRYAIASVSGDTVTFTVASWAATGSGTADLFGRSYVRSLFTGATATSATLGAQRNGFSTVADAGYTVLTTASPGAEMQFHNVSTEVSFQDKLIASSATPNMTMRAKRDESIPDDNVDLYLYVWSHNAASAPTATTWTLQFVNVEKFANTDVYLRGIKPMGTDNPLPVIFPSAQAVSGTVTANLGTGGTGATSLGKAEDAAAASGDTGVPIWGVRRDALTTSSSATGDYNEIAVNRFGAKLVSDFRLNARTYRAAFTVSPAAAATDVFELAGNASSTVVVTKFSIHGIATSASELDVSIIKRSAVDTGGTSSSATHVPLDSTDAASTAVSKIYTANPTPGASVGAVERCYVPLNSATASGETGHEFEFGNKGKGVVLAGVAQSLAVNLNGVTPSGCILTVTVEWYEF